MKSPHYKVLRHSSLPQTIAHPKSFRWANRQHVTDLTGVSLHQKPKWISVLLSWRMGYGFWGPSVTKLVSVRLEDLTPCLPMVYHYIGSQDWDQDSAPNPATTTLHQKGTGMEDEVTLPPPKKGTAKPQINEATVSGWRGGVRGVDTCEAMDKITIDTCSQGNKYILYSWLSWTS